MENNNKKQIQKIMNMLNDDDFTTTQMAKELNLKSAKWLNADVMRKKLHHVSQRNAMHSNKKRM